MTTYTLKLVGIDETGSIGRQLKANINGTNVDFLGTTNKHRIIAGAVPVNGVTNVPIAVDVIEWDAKASDGTYSGSTSIAIDPASANNPTASVSVNITEIGGKGKNKGKSATLTFHFQAELKTKFDISDIPSIMAADGWTNGAVVMNKWFSASAATASKSVQPPDTGTIKMSWVLSFARAKTVYDDLVANTLTNKKVISLLKKKYAKTNGKFGDFSLPVEKLHPDNIQHGEVGNSSSVDDMFCALGHFSIYVVVKGVATKDEIGITHIGLFVYDSYDFNGHQILGWWDKPTNYGALDPRKGNGVDNGDFRDYRNSSGKGGDFYIYSDLIVTKLNKPVIIDK